MFGVFVCLQLQGNDQPTQPVSSNFDIFFGGEAASGCSGSSAGGGRGVIKAA